MSISNSRKLAEEALAILNQLEQTPLPVGPERENKLRDAQRLLQDALREINSTLDL